MNEGLERSSKPGPSKTGIRVKEDLKAVLPRPPGTEPTEVVARRAAQEEAKPKKRGRKPKAKPEE